MGLYGAMTTAVAGLTAQSYALENISGNIANSQTTGFKRVDTSFSDIVMSFGTSSNRQTSGSVMAQSRATNSLQGAVESSAVDTFMAISGDGYFQVQKKVGESDGNEIFSGADVYTRRGDFMMDRQGYLTNGAGYYLKAIPIDTATGNPVGDVAQVFKLTAGYLAANPSTKIDYNANLPADPKVGIFNQAGFNPNPATATLTPTQQAATIATMNANIAFTPIDVNTKDFSFKVNGQLVTLTNDATATGGDGVYDLGEAIAEINTQLAAASPDSGIRVAEQVDNTNTGIGKLSFTTGATDVGSTATITLSDFSASNLGYGTSAQTVHGTDTIEAGTGVVSAGQAAKFTKGTLDGGSVTVYDGQGSAVDVQFRWAKMSDSPEKWNLFYESNPSATGTDTQWTNAGTDFVFDSDGNMTQPAGSTISIANMSVGTKSLGNLAMNFGKGGLTQYAASQGTVDVTLLNQDGYASGSLSSIGVSDGGRITATYSNGQQIDVAEVPLFKFNASQALKRLDGSAFSETRESGTALQMNDTNITGGALEASNTDIAQEFSKMIVTQQAYSANSKIISTTNDMMQAILNILR
jgi:flagellar hook protein FlgE